MLNRIITWSLGHRFLVILFTLVLLGTGAYSLYRLPIDAFPDTTPVQVQINTVAPALSALEIEQGITFPVEQAIGGLRGLVEVRSISKFGLSQVTVIFEDGTDIYFARQVVMERLGTVELPAGTPRPEMGPVSTGLGEVYHYIVTGKGKTLEELTTLHDWVIKPRLASVAGVAEVNTWGGERKQYHVLIDLSRLMKYDLLFDDVSEALLKNNLNVGGGNITQSGELHLVRGISLTQNVSEIENIVITAHDGTPIRIRDVATVKVGHEIRRGASTANGQGEVVLGLGFMLMGENSDEVTRRLKERLEDVRESLPSGVEIHPVYDRTTLVDQVLDTARNNLLEGGILVVAVLFIFLGNLRAGLIVAAAIPLSMCFAFNGMLRFGIVGSLMSLGAIDLGFIVDSTLVMVENNVRHLEEAVPGRSVMDVVREASIQVARPTVFAQTINMIVYLPVLALEGIEGKLFQPMSLTILLALSGSVLLICTVIPVLTSLFLTKRTKVRKDHITSLLRWLYRPVVRLVLKVPVAFSLLPVGVIVVGAWLATNTGSEFIPRLSEMGIVINTVRLSGVSVEESARYGTRIEKLIAEKFPDEVKDVWTRTGTAEVATDPMGIELSDVFITLTDRKEWTRAGTQDQLTSLLREELSGMPGMRMVFTQPIEMRVNEMIAGIRTDLGVKIFGDDLELLRDKASEVEAIVRSIPGSADIYTEQITGQPVLEIRVDQEAIARYGVPARHVLEIVEAIGARHVGEIRQGQRRFDLVIRLDKKYRKDISAVGRILVPAAGGERIPLVRLARIRQIEGPSTITREWQKRRIMVQCNVTGRDIGGFVEDVQSRIKESLVLPTGYHVEFGGQFEHLQRATKRLMIVVPLALLLIFVLLHAATNSTRASLIIFLGPAFAALGGLLALHLRGMPFTVSAGVGFVVASGVSVLNGLVLVSTIKDRLARGTPALQAIEDGALLRLRPICMAGMVAVLGFLPMALSTGVGAEVQRSLATVVIGGVIADNLLTLLVLPALYALFGIKKPQPERTSIA
ncbi:MAG: CusA/CzcA family heavy metal efflux RND transporter [Phycisphaerae bacterium]|jgi:cobalt-zinc-cadmium resistance protein CzcA|nr:CusA/CzcA family heavy metal efflux RND transporter [Phycisphaerae bacterium]